MASAEEEDQLIGIALSFDGLPKPNKKKNANVSASFPFISPNFSFQWFKKTPTKSIDQKDNFSLNESKQMIRELAAGLDRVIQSKMSLVSRKIKHKGTKEEQQYYFLQWAEELENKEITSVDKEEEHVSFEDWSNDELKLSKAKKILSEWTWKLKDMKQNSVRPNGDIEETLRDLHRKWKQRESSILPVMDWMVWTVLHPESSERDSVSRQWVKKKQTFKNTIGLHIPTAVWNWITQLKADVILDPNTANPDLLISEDGKSLRTREYTGVDNWHGFQMKRTKYDGWTCVQAKDGYETGRHYWEVDVRWKSEWRVGVVKESAPRNGFVTMNTRTGYWNLRLQLGTLMGLTEPVTKLNLLAPSKIGVYLDVEERHVSFYDAEKRRHLYTFNTDYDRTEKLYPVFGTVETDRALVIS